MFSFSWAMTLFGLQQTLNLLKPPQVTKAFDDVSATTSAQFGDLLSEAFKAGDKIQRELVDLTLGGFVGQISDRKISPVAIGQSTVGAQPGIGLAISQTTSNIHPSAAAATPISHQQSGWGPMPVPLEPVATSPSRPASHQSIAEPNISPDYPYKSHYLDVFGSKMHYIDEGSGETILLLHGNPTWSYLWRNVIPHLKPLGRCIAPDLIGYGRSDKPNIEYRWFDHVRYLEEFIAKMDLKNVTLVLHDQGSGLGFHYAMHHQNNVKGIAFFEAIVRPYAWNQFSTPEFREIFRSFRTGGIGGEGWKLIVEQNFFIEVLLPQAAGRPLTDVEMNYYREPFRDQQSRLPVWRFPNETPIGGEPADVWSAVSEYSKRLQKSDLPKLMLYAEPGALLTSENVDWCRRNIRNLSSVFLGPGSHFLQESCPHRIGQEVAKWYRSLPSR